MPRQILLLPLLMSLNAGFVDTAGFLALQGLFTAHVTGNFVTFGASMVLGTSGALAKLLALPVFCLVVIGTRVFSFLLPAIGLPIFRSMLALKVLLLAAGAVCAVHFGPFVEGDSWQAICTGMILVAAMAIQNAAHRIHMGTEPPTTLMTGTTTQIMIDVADVLRGAPATVLTVAKPRLSKMAASVTAFALGCAAGAVLYAKLGTLCFVIPPLIALPAVFLASAEPK
ncbi:YoaK family protein [Bradyrhizobium tropiciagri]|uniref:YoaK family protein n=1 Tax=Bradyrhizobium tropiciagri TaxID=312253 RepID=UPI00067B7DA1|nr:YoaK family protein [Bradyrhizobium tropiciagri]